MNEVTIRPATESDISALVSLWHEKAAVQQQSDQRFTLLPDAEQRRAEALRIWLHDERCQIIVGQRADAIVGYIIGWIEAAPPGLAPERIGLISDLAVGLHTYLSGLGRVLLDAMRAWFAGQDVGCVLAQVPRRQPVEQAFWRALGATELTDIMWMKLE